MLPVSRRWPGDAVDVDMMHQTDRFRYMSQDGFQVLEMPYEGDRPLGRLLVA